MGDYDRTKEYRPKKYYNVHRERREPPLWAGPRRMPVILTKPNRDREMDTDKSVENRPAVKLLSQPTMILRNRDVENRAGQQASKTGNILRKDSDSQPVYQLAAKHSMERKIDVNPLAPPPQMKSPVKLLDDTLQLNDSILEFLLDQPDFIVVGLLGLQGVGKSTIASLIAGSDIDDSIHKPLFKVHGQEQHETGSHCTNGIDVLVTPSRLIILDTQPVLSPSIMDRQAHQEGKKFGGPSVGPSVVTGPADFTSTENSVEIHSLQQAAFLLSVCHIVIFVQDWFFDANVIRFLQTAEMLKPSISTTSADDDIIEYFPHVLFMQNRVCPSDFGPRSVRLMQDTYNQFFLRSRLQVQTGMGVAHGDVMPSLTPETCGEPFNLYLFPDITYELMSKDSKSCEPRKPYFQGHPGLPQLISKLRAQLLGSAIQPLTHNALTEKNWFLYATKLWETIKKSSFFLEYSRLLP